MRSEIASFLMTKSLIRDSEVIHDGLKLILRGQAGVQQIPAFGFPLVQPPVVEYFEVIRNNERNNFVPQALLEEQKPPDTAISILKRMDGFKGIVEFQQVFQRLGRILIVRR